MHDGTKGHGFPDGAERVGYVPADPTDWATQPATVRDALDKLAAAAGGSGAPTNAEYVTLVADATLSNERVATAGDGIAIDDAGAGNPVTFRTRSTVYITNATGAGVISGKTYQADSSPPNKVLTAFQSDNDDITLTLEVHAGTDAWQPASVQVAGGGATPVTVLKQDWTQVDNTRIWTASVNLTDADTTDTLTATMSDGDTATVAYTRALDPPLVLTAVFDTHPATTGGDAKCPGLQTQVKSGDTVRITGTTESHADEVYVKNAGVSSTLQGPFTVTAGAYDFTCNVGSRSSATQTATLYAKVTGGSPGADFGTTNTIDQDQTAPTFTGGSQSDIAYPASQEALKDAELCTVTVTHTNIDAGDTYLYDDNSTGELTIPNTTTYQAAKASVTRLSGNYRESGTNYRLTATRTTKNGASTTRTVTVRIAHTAPTLTVTPNTRFGTDDGTNGYRDRTITITSSQANLSTHAATMTADAGDTSSFTGSWSASGDLAYTRSFRVEDADINAGGQAANDFSWAGVSVKNRAGKEATTITTNPDYSIGGFQKRRLTIPAWPNREAVIGCVAVDTANLTAEALSKGGDGPGGGTVQTFDNSPGQGLTPDDEVDKFCISDGGDLVDDDGQYYYNKDQPNAVSNTSGTAQVDIEETA